jgi:hypothetical protein
MLRPRCGRKLKSQCSPKALRSQPTQAQASHNDHAAWPPPAASRWAILARIQPRSRSATRSAWPTANHLPRRRPSRPSAGPARPAPASSARLQPRADDAPSWTCRATTPTRPSQPRGGRPHPPHPGTSFPSDTADAGTHGRRRPDTGHLDASDARTGHRSHGQAPHGTPDARTGHWTPDAGHERGHGDDSPAGIRTSLAATPSDRTLRRATCLCSCTTSRLLGHAAGQAAPRRTALVCWSWMVRGEGNGTTER